MGGHLSRGSEDLGGVSRRLEDLGGGRLSRGSEDLRESFFLPHESGGQTQVGRFVSTKHLYLASTQTKS